MKWLIASDIHGSAFWCRKLLEAFDREEADRLLLLGDLLYHGPRNALPDEYDPGAVADLLNARRDRILCVRGNCEAEVDQVVLTFPVMAEYAALEIGRNHIIFVTHGHVYNEKNMPPMNIGDILLNGHTHVPKCVEHEYYTYMNPGSVAIPKDGSWHGYMTLEDGFFQWKDFDGTVHMDYTFDLES